MLGKVIELKNGEKVLLRPGGLTPIDVLGELDDVGVGTIVRASTYPVLGHPGRSTAFNVFLATSEERRLFEEAN